MKLYRYLSISGEVARKRARDTIVSSLVYFQSPHNFNDPFDCKTLFHSGRVTDAMWQRHYANAIRIQNSRKSEKEIGDLVKSAMKRGLHNNPTYLKTEAKRLQKVLSNAVKKLGILCMSEVSNDILMWSHYSDGHRGICLQFDSVKLQKHFYMEKVQYRTPYITFKEFLDLFDATLLHKLLIFKSAHWCYECEWRAIHNIHRKDARLLRLPRGIITGVILGCQVSDRNRTLVQGWVNSMEGNLQLYEARKNLSSYGVRIFRLT